LLQQALNNEKLPRFDIYTVPGLPEPLLGLGGGGLKSLSLYKYHIKIYHNLSQMKWVKG